MKTNMEVRLIRCLASDEMVVQAAKVSTKGENTVFEGDKVAGLVRYLVKKKHGSPFEHTFFQWYLKGPVPIFREFQRHRIGFSYNEMSGRYMELPDEQYAPDRERPIIQVGSSAHPRMAAAPDPIYDEGMLVLVAAYEQAWNSYQILLKLGWASEVARFALSQGMMSQMYVTCNARSLMNFLSLRVHDPEALFPSNPQWEIEWLARRMEEEFANHMPITHQAFIENGRVAP